MHASYDVEPDRAVPRVPCIPEWMAKLSQVTKEVDTDVKNVKDIM